MTSMASSNQDSFQRLADALAAAGDPNKIDLRTLVDDLERHIEDLKKLLDEPGKNDTSRCKLKDGRLASCF